MSAPLDLTFSVVSHGQGRLMNHLLEQLDASAELKGSRVVVTLNQVAESFDAARYANLDIVVIRNQRPAGFGANHNSAFKFCKTGWFVILNPDLRISGNQPFLAMIEHAAACPEIAVMAPRVIDARGMPEDAVRSNLTPWSLLARHLLGRRGTPDIQQPSIAGRPFYWLAGMCLMVKARAFAEIGGFDERFFLYCEDYDLCARLYGKGHAIAVDPSVQIVHEAQRDSRRSWKHLRWHVSSLLRVWMSRVYWIIMFGRPGLQR